MKGARRTRSRQGAGFADLMSTQSQPARGVITGMSRLQNTGTPSVKSTPNSSAPSTPRPAPAQEDWDSLLTISPRRRISPLSSKLGARSRPASVKNDSPPSRTPRISSLNLNTSNQTSSRNSSAPRTPTFSESARPASLSLPEEPKPPAPARHSVTPVVPSFLTGWDGADGWGDDPSLDDSDPEADEGTWGEWGDVADIAIPEEKSDITSAETPLAPVNIQSSEIQEEHPGEARATTAANEKETNSEPLMASSPVQIGREPVQLDNKERSVGTDLAMEPMCEPIEETVDKTEHDAHQSEEPIGVTSPQPAKSQTSTHGQADDARTDGDDWGAWGESQPPTEQNVFSFSILPDAPERAEPPVQAHPTQSDLGDEEEPSVVNSRELAPANEPVSSEPNEDPINPSTSMSNQLETTNAVSEPDDAERQSPEIGASDDNTRKEFQSNASCALETNSQVPVQEDNPTNVTQDTESDKQPTPESNSTSHVDATKDMTDENSQQQLHTVFKDEALENPSQDMSASSNRRTVLNESEKGKNEGQVFFENEDVFAAFEPAAGEDGKQEEGEAWGGWDDDVGISVTVDQSAIASEEAKDTVYEPTNSDMNILTQRDAPSITNQTNQEQVPDGANINRDTKRETEEEEMQTSSAPSIAVQDTPTEEAAKKQHELPSFEPAGEFGTKQQVIDFGTPEDVPQIEDNVWGGWGDVDDFAIPEEGNASPVIEEREETAPGPSEHSGLEMPHSAKDDDRSEYEAHNSHRSQAPTSLQIQVDESVQEEHQQYLPVKQEAAVAVHTHRESNITERELRLKTGFAETHSAESLPGVQEELDIGFSVGQQETDQPQYNSEAFVQNAFQEQPSSEQFSLNVEDAVAVKPGISMTVGGKQETNVFTGMQGGIKEGSQQVGHESEFSGVDITPSAPHEDATNFQIMDSFKVDYQPESNGEEWGGWDDMEIAAVPDAQSAPSPAPAGQKDENQETSGLGATVHPSIDYAPSIPKSEEDSTQLPRKLDGGRRETLSREEEVTNVSVGNDQVVQQEYGAITVPEDESASLTVPPEGAVMQSFAQANAVSPGFGSWGGWEESTETADLSQRKSPEEVQGTIRSVLQEPVRHVLSIEPNTVASPHRTPFENNDIGQPGDFVPREATTAPQTESVNRHGMEVTETPITPEVKDADEHMQISTQAAYASSYWTQKLNDGNIPEIKDSTITPAEPPISVSQSAKPVYGVEEDKDKGGDAFKQRPEGDVAPDYDPFAPTGDVVQTEQGFLEGFDLETSHSEEPRSDALWFQTEADSNTKKPGFQGMNTKSGEPFDNHYSSKETDETRSTTHDGLASAFMHSAHPEPETNSTLAASDDKATPNERYYPAGPFETEVFNPVEEASDKQAAESEASSYLPSLDHANIEGKVVREISPLHDTNACEGRHDSPSSAYPSAESHVEKGPVSIAGERKDSNKRARPFIEEVCTPHGGAIEHAASMVKHRSPPSLTEDEFMINAPHQEQLLSTDPSGLSAQAELRPGIEPGQSHLEGSFGTENKPSDIDVLESVGVENRESQLDSFEAPSTDAGNEKNLYAPNRFDRSTEPTTVEEGKESLQLQYPIAGGALESHENDHVRTPPESYQASVPQTNDPIRTYDIDLQAYAPKQTSSAENTTYKHPSPEASGLEDHPATETATGSVVENSDPTPNTYGFGKNQDKEMVTTDPYQYHAYQSSIYDDQGEVPPHQGYSYAQAIEETHGADPRTMATSINPYAPHPVSAQGNLMEVFENVPMDPNFGGNGPVSVPQTSLPQPAFESHTPSGFPPSEAAHHSSAETRHESNMYSVQASTAEQGSSKPTEESVSATHEVNIPEVGAAHYRPVSQGAMPNLETPSHPNVSATETYPQYSNELPGYAYGEYYTRAPEATTEAAAEAETQQDSTYLDSTFFSYPFSIMDTSPSGDMIHPGPRPIVTWGFAGSMVTVFPTQQDQAGFVSSSAGDAHNAGHTVQIFDMSPLGRDGTNDDWIAASEAVHPLSYPLKTSDLEPYAKMCENLSQLSAGLGGPAAEGRAALWRILALFCRTEGEGWKREAGHAVCGPTSVPLFGRNAVQSAPSNGQAKDLLPSRHGQSDSEAQAVALEVERLLTEGKGVEAVNYAKKSGMWSLALILSEMVDKKLYTSILCDYAKNILQEGSALQTLCFSLAENDAEIIRRITSPAGLEEWRKNVGMLLNSGASVTTSKAKETRFLHLIEQVGDALITQRADVVGAHVCYLLSGRLGALDPKGICLLGANPNTSPGQPRSLGSAGAILQSLVYEAVVNARSGAAFPHLLPFRLFLAQEIASVGHPDIALAHCDSISKQVRAIFESRNNAIAAQFTAPFLSSLESFDQRLRAHLGLQEEVGNLTKLSALGKSLSSVFSRASKERQSNPSTSADGSQDRLPTTTSLAPSAISFEERSKVPVSIPFNHPPHLSVDSQWGVGYNSLQTSAGFVNQNPDTSNQASKTEKSGKEKWDQFVSKTIGLIAPADYDLSPPPPSRVPPSMAQHPAPIGLDGGSGSRTNTQGLTPSHMRSSSVGAIPSAFFNSTPGLTAPNNGGTSQARSHESQSEKSVPPPVSSEPSHALMNGVPLQKVTREENNDALVHRRSASDMTLQSQTSEKKPPLHPKKPGRTSKVSDTSGTTDRPTQKKGWRERLREKLTATFGGPPRAHMGEENKFVFDKQRGRWVIEGEEPGEEEDVPPPPPDDDEMYGTGGNRVQASSSYDPLPSTEHSAHNASTLLRSQSAQDALGSNGFNPPYTEHTQVPASLNPSSSGPGSLDNSFAGDDGSANSVASAASAPVPYSAASSSKISASGTNNRDMNKYRRVGRPSGRRAYVDTFNKGKPSMSTSALPTPARPAVPAYGGITAATGGGYNVFTPTPLPSTSTGDSNMAQGASSTTSVVETSDQLNTLSDTSSPHNMLAPTPSVGHAHPKPPTRPSDGFSTGRQPRMMA